MFKESANNPSGKHNVNPSLFKTYIETEAEEDDIIWEKGMKLEVLDPLDNWKELRVSTIIEVMNDGFLKVRVFFFFSTFSSFSNYMSNRFRVLGAFWRFF